MKNIQFIIYTGIVVMSACSKDLNYAHSDESVTEDVNGFTVRWMGGVSEEKMSIIRTILNNMVHVEGGTFTMGVNPEYDHDARSNEGPAHIVRLSDYYICSRELDMEQVACFADYHNYNHPSLNNIYFSYADWESFIHTLNAYTGLTFDFPTEAQWEFAARGGNKSLNFQYPGSNKLEDVWHEGEIASDLSQANELGLYNMADLRSEWCKDMYANYSAKTIYTDPCNLYGKYRVIRGGCTKSNSIEDSWFSFDNALSQHDFRFCRSTARAYGYNLSYKDITWRPVINILRNEK